MGTGIAGDILAYIEKNADIKYKYAMDVSKLGLPREQVEEQDEEAAKAKVKDDRPIPDVEEVERDDEENQEKDEF